MKQYCRYCADCHAIDDGLYYCNVKEKIFNESKIIRPTNCKDYSYIPLDAITDKEHIIKERQQLVDDGEQLCMY